MTLNKVQKIEDQIFDLEVKKRMILDANFKQASKHWLTLLNARYDSASNRTPQYLTFCRVFKTQFTKLLKSNFNIEKIEIFKPNHFDSGGFFELENGKIFYFSIGDLRWNKSFLIRTAKDFKDYTGGINQYCEVEKGIDIFTTDLLSMVNFN